VRRTLEVISRVAGLGSALFLAAMMLVTVADVGLRALFNLPITGAYDLVQLFLVGTVFLSIPEVFLDDENIVVDFIDHIAGTAVVDLLKAAARLVAFGFIAVLSWKMLTPALDAWRFKEVSPDLSIPMVVHWTLMIAGIVLALPIAGLLAVESIRNVTSRRDTR
jgi:TRAP-type C4-dicarboxylate transport system permease small subunit